MYDRQKHLISLKDWNQERILDTLDQAILLKKELREQGPSQRYRGRTLAMFFEKPSLRTITTFQVGFNQLGGLPVLLDPGSIGMGKRESVADISRCLSRWVDGLVVRCFQQELVEELAKHGSFPVINALTDTSHPCQALALGQTLREHFGNLEGLTVTFVGDGNNVANSIMELCARTGMNFVLSCPQGFEQDPALVEEMLPAFKARKRKYTCEHDPVQAVREASVIYTDVWVSMGQESEKNSKQMHFLPYQVNDALLAKAPSGCKVSHCLPAHREEEITHSVMESAVNLCFDEAENRLHVQKAVLCQLVQKL